MGQFLAEQPLPDSVLKVAVAVPLSRVFDYLPNGDIDAYQIGARVLVSFARRTVVGVVVGFGQPSVELSKVKSVDQLLDSVPQVPADIVSLIQWAAAYYHHPLGEAWATALPVALRRASFKAPKESVVYLSLIHI